MTSGEYLSSNTGISYPFKHGQEIPDQLVRLFADACIYSDSFDQSLTEANYSIGTGVFKFVVGSVEYSLSVSSKGTFIVANNGCSSFVIDREYLDTIADFEFTGDLKFEESCFVAPSRTVTSIEIYNGEGDPRNAVLSGDVCFCQGYNIDLSAQDGMLRISASPGAGAGTVPCDTSECDEDPETNGEPLVTDSGNAVITADDCYEITASGDTIQIHGKCVACCQCQDYIDVVNILKDVAGRVKNTKDDLTGTKTDIYFDFIHKQSFKNGYPDLDIQLDISPDAELSSIAARGPLSEERDYYSFRVKATITNMSGVPCLIMTPSEAWTGSEIAKYFSRLTGGNDCKLIDGTTAPLQYCMNHGLIPCLGFGTPGYYVAGDSHISSKVGRNDPRGWLSQVRSRGPVIRQYHDANSDIKYEQPITTVDSVSTVDHIKNGIKTAVDTCTEWAIADLNAGRNPSGMLNKYPESLTNTLLKTGVDLGTARGFLAPAGYSFTVSWVYVIPGTILDKLRSIMVVYSCVAYAPLIAYTLAYDWAVSETKRRTTADGTVYYNTWKAGDYKIPDYRLMRQHTRWAVYDLKLGKQSYRGNENSKWK